MGQQTNPDESIADELRAEIADLEGCRPEQLGMLETAVDLDELNELVESPGAAEGRRSLSFRYCGYQVAVTSDRGVVVQP
jgi:hypothetical protein